MRKIIVVLIFTIFLLIPKNVHAINDPLSVTNNRFGIHILDPKDLNDAKYLVNSSRGDWGYVTMVIREDERDIKKWQEVFDNLRRYHLIPIIRLATKQEGSGWEKFRSEDVDNWVYFLNSLNWVIKNRYVVIGNEPNHAEEWGGSVNPSEYSDILCLYSQKLKEASGDFFILPSGLDASASNTKTSVSEEVFIKEMYQKNDFSKCIDGWTSHSYPNPNFSGLETASGRGSVKTYLWEENLLKGFSISKKFPIFITETGWAHKTNTKKQFLDIDELTKKYEYVLNNVWIEDNIVAITPFVIDYKEPLFDQFSWKDDNGNFYSFHKSLLSINKLKGIPIQKDDGEILLAIIPKISNGGDHIRGLILLKNKGQSIWDNNLKIIVDINNEIYENNFFTSLEPAKTHWQYISFYLPISEDSIRGKIYLSKDNNKIGASYNFEVLLFKRNSSLKDKFAMIYKLIFNYLKQSLSK